MKQTKLLLSVFSMAVCALGGLNFYMNRVLESTEVALANLEAVADGEEKPDNRTTSELYCRVIYYYTDNDEWGWVSRLEDLPGGAHFHSAYDGHKYDCEPEMGSTCNFLECTALEQSVH